ncbi:hypothetical protein AB1L30_23700 [Bremerella sp. JC817]|uniref:hypothetical protein n=1 Tax=Bremerella sp. JC817 TaxID=3231756 RepID=UPI00345A577E
MHAASDTITRAIDFELRETTTDINFPDNTVDVGFLVSGTRFLVEDSATANVRMLNTTIDSFFSIETTASNLNYEVFNGQSVPAPLSTADASGQNTIGGIFSITTGSGTSNTRVAPNSLPIPE